MTHTKSSNVIVNSQGSKIALSTVEFSCQDLDRGNCYDYSAYESDPSCQGDCTVSEPEALHREKGFGHMATFTQVVMLI